MSSALSLALPEPPMQSQPFYSTGGKSLTRPRTHSSPFPPTPEHSNSCADVSPRPLSMDPVPSSMQNSVIDSARELQVRRKRRNLKPKCLQLDKNLQLNNDWQSRMKLAGFNNPEAYLEGLQGALERFHDIRGPSCEVEALACADGKRDVQKEQVLSKRGGL